MSNSISRRSLLSALALSGLAVTSVALTGCGHSSSSASASGGGDGKTLKVWWWETSDSALSMAWNKAIDIFKQEHSGVEVKFELKTYEQMQQSGQLILDSKDAPDVLEYLKGNATAGTVSKAGLLTDMSDVAKQRKWDMSNSSQDVGLYDKGLMGSGQRYGITNYGEFVGVWYNEDQFTQYGLKVPTTVAELETVMQAFVDKGITPLALGSNDYFGLHMLYELVLGHTTTDQLASYQRFQGSVDWTVWQQAAQTLSDWVGKGFISKNSTGISAQDAGNAFIAGKYPMMVSGSWWAASVDQQAKFKYGQFLFPENKLHPGSGGNLWVVPAKASNKELAYDFIEITMRQEVQQFLGDKGGLPVAEVKTNSTIAGLMSDLFKQASTSPNALAWYPDWPVAGLDDTFLAQISGLVQGSVTPANAVKTIQQTYDSGKPTS